MAGFTFFGGSGDCVMEKVYLKGLSNEIDLKNFDKFTELGLSKGRGWFLNFMGAPMIV